MGKQAKIAAILVVSFALWGCEAAVPSTSLTDGKVVSVGQKNLILQDGKSVMFISIEASDKERLKDLKKGDLITLVSKAEDDGRTIDVVEIITADGVHIPLGS